MPVPLTAIRAFEAAARSLSFKLAAEELGVTPTAVSHQIRNLEQTVSKRLFIRNTREVVLSEAGREFYQAVGPSIQTISSEFEKLLNPGNRVTVTLGAAPLFFCPMARAQARPFLGFASRNRSEHFSL